MHNEATSKASRTRKSVAALIIAGLLGATSLSAISAIEAVTPARADQTVFNRAPAAGFSDLVEKVMPAVVSVEAKLSVTPASASSDDEQGGQGGQQFSMPDLPQNSPFRQFFDQFPQGKKAQPQPRQGGIAQGSGFIISADGYMVTNNHVVQDADEVTVRTNNDKEYKAKVIGTDAKTDLALLKIDSNETFSYVPFATKDPRVGDWVIAVGNPFGLGGTVTTGIISARGRNIGSGPYDDYLQIDAPINKGNSGGPAFNLDGEVVGINTAIFSPSGGSVGIGFAIPAHEAVSIVSSLKEHGTVTRGWLGVQIQPITDDIAESVHLKDTKGALVADVTADSPALKAGLKAGDAILKLDGTAVKDPSDLSRQVAGIEPGKQVTLTVLRDGAEKDIAVSIGKMPSDKQLASLSGQEDSAPAKGKLGLQLQASPDGRGVAVAGVTDGSPAAEKGLKTGDVILQIGGTDVDDPAALSGAIEKARKDGQKNVLLLVKSGERQRFVALPAQPKG
ncbi:MAG: Do family serine endopeptidase [Hyphomicrobiales bacterium]